ncbi:NAD(P)H-dependent oxidoreductase [Bacillus cereus]
MKLLHIDSSALGANSVTRELTAAVAARWQDNLPGLRVEHLDLDADPIPHLTGRSLAKDDPAETERSERILQQFLQADVIVIGAPMYNFGMPAQFKAWIDNIVRVGRTFGFDRAREGEPYWPMLTDSGKRLVLLSSRGDYGYGKGERLEAINHVEPGVLTPLRYIGITQAHSVAAEYDEFGGERLRASLERAEGEIDALVERLVAEHSLLAAA